MNILSCKEIEGGWLVNGNMSVPNDPANMDCRAVQEWIAEGNTPEPPDPPPAPTFEQMKDMLKGRVQAMMDAKAGERNYDGILSLCTYATSTNPTFAAEGQAGVEWRDAVWTKCYEILVAVEAGTREVPTEQELLGELPTFIWPE